MSALLELVVHVNNSVAAHSFLLGRATHYRES